MIDRHFLFFLIIATFLTGGCSGNAEVIKSANSSGNPSAAAAHALNTGQATNSNVMPNNPAVNTTPAGAFENPNKRNVTDSPGAARPDLHYEQIAENSQIAQAMNSSGQMYEVRIWARNPQLLKVESIWIDDKNKALTIILRSGKIFKITTDRIANVKTATANQFLELAGVQPVPATPSSKSAPRKAE